MTIHKVQSSCRIFPITFSLLVALTAPAWSGAQRSQVDKNALIQIDKDLDVHNKLNWFVPGVPPHESNPGDDRAWETVRWDNGRVVGIGNPPLRFENQTTGFAALTELQILSLHKCGITDLHFLKGLKNLDYLDLSYNEISDVTSLSEMDKLQLLKLSHNKISDLTPHANSGNLWQLDLSFNEIHDITPFTVNPIAVTDLRLDHNKIEDISSIGKICVWQLDLSNNEIRDISPLETLWKTNIPISDDASSIKPFLFGGVNKLFLSNNKISDVSGLLNSDSKVYIELDNNNIPLSQLYTLMAKERIYFGVQNNVILPLVPEEAYVGQEYDIQSEAVFDGIPTDFHVYTLNGSKCKPGKEFIIKDNAWLIFLKEGEFRISMRNSAIYSKVRYTRMGKIAYFTTLKKIENPWITVNTGFVKVKKY